MEKISKYDIKLFKNLLNENITTEDNICLITSENLKDNNIELNCGHKFNYEALYNEVVYQKTRKLLDNSQLKINEVKCPYCRNVTNKLLPFYKYYSIKQVRGVTYPEEYCMKIYECEHVKNGKKCTKSGCKTENGIFCNKHLVITKEDEIILKNESKDVFNYYKQKKIVELKKILNLNHCKVGGNKEELVNRIIINKNKIVNWLED
jgi:hypothetical protein